MEKGIKLGVKIINDVSGLNYDLKTKDIKTRISEFDKHLLSGDSRRSESKKFGGPGARRRKQKSYR